MSLVYCVDDKWKIVGYKYSKCLFLHYFICFSAKLKGCVKLVSEMIFVLLSTRRLC